MEQSLLRIFDEVLFAMEKAELISTYDREYLNNKLKFLIEMELKNKGG